tara:strand:- start:64 stop:267 length:204 start_codon:yes stop_codon:yes gene_type:complete
MKNISKLILGIGFVFGMTSMSDADVSKTTTKVVVMRVPCENVFTVCDNHAPDNYEHFVSCMNANGCG